MSVLKTLLVCIFFIVGCLPASHLSKKSLVLYGSFHVDYRILHETSKSSLLLQLPAEPFTLQCVGYKNYRGKEILWQKKQEFKATTEVVSLEIPQPEIPYLLEVKITTLKEGEAFKTLIEIEADRFEQLIDVKTVDGYRTLKNVFQKGETVDISSPFDSLFVSYYDRSFRPARPPFSSIPGGFNPLVKRKKFDLLEKGKLLRLEWEGLYFIQKDKNAVQGVYLNCFGEEFPKVDDIKELAQTIRYITKNEEYKGLRNAENTKEALDKFWLDRSTDKERSRNLIRTYYNRVQMANLRFTTYKEGWKTDRGMIYTVFGPPLEINHYKRKEIWIYPILQGDSGPVFVFDIVRGQHILRRSPDLEVDWMSQIYDWRERGR